MNATQLKIPVSASLGSVSAEVIIPSSMKSILVLAHGAGAGMDHRFMTSLAQALANRNIGTLRYNFLYMELGKKVPDPAGIAEKTVGVAIEKAINMHPSVPVIAGGKSFGGRMTSQYMAKHDVPALKGIVFYGFPLHAPGKPGTERSVHLHDVKVPMLFLQGTRDALAEISLIESVCAKLPGSTLRQFQGADHSFKAGKKEYIDELAEVTDEWLTKL